MADTGFRKHLMTDFTDRLRAAIAPAYELGEELPGGGMSRVFVATERALGRRVVVKVLPPDLAAGVNRERFQREIQLAASLQHPHIVPLLAAGESGELLYYTMPFIDGESLRDWVSRKGRLSVRDVVRMLHDVVDALAYAHSRGVVHRDIKPGNILTQGSHALVTDFGVAKAISAALPGSGMTTTGMAIGTPAYMAPEQLAADPSADHRIDLYAVGLLAYELLTGASPFASKSPTETMAAQFSREPPPLERARHDVPPALASLVRRLLAKSPDERPADAQQVLAALDDIQLPGGSGTPTRSIGARSPGSGRLRKAGIVAAALAGLMIAAAGGAVWASRQVMSMFDSPERPVVQAGSGAAPTDTIILGDSAQAVVLSAPPPASESATSRLTRADSIAIAEAVRAELARAGRRAEQEPAAAASPTRARASGEAATIEAERLAARLQRRFVDSVLRSSMAEVSRTVPRVYTFRSTPTVPVAPPPGVAPEHWARVRIADSMSLMTGERVQVEVGSSARAAARPVRRVLIAAAHEEDPAIASLSAATIRSLRGMLMQRPGFDAVSPLAAQTAVGAAGSLEAAASHLNAELVATVDLIGVPGDSVVMLIKLRDLTAAAPFSYRVAASGTVARAQFGDVMARTLRSAVEQMSEMSRAARRE